MFTRDLPAIVQNMIHTLPDLSANCEIVLEKRYWDKTLEGELTEDSNGLFWRVGYFLSQAAVIYGELTEADHVKQAVKYFRLMRGGLFLPNSPTLANAGTRTGQLSACFVLPIADALANGQDGIFDTLTDAQLIFQTGGGVGFAFTRLRPKDDIVSSTRGKSTGPDGYMDVFNVACENIKQGGMRRGAQMGVMRVDHPDIEIFINAKEDLDRLTNFNVSVGTTDCFEAALERGQNGDDDTYELVFNGKVYKTESALRIWDLIITRAWGTGEPGVVRLDYMNEENPVPGLGSYEATNPCGEQPLVPYESCNLGSINLGEYVKEGPDGVMFFDEASFLKDVKDSTELLDDVVDMNEFVPARGHNPGVPEIKQVTQQTRKLGLGVMGTARMLFKLHLPYDSDAGRAAVARAFALLDLGSKEASIARAKRYGPYPYMAGNQAECTAFYERLWMKRALLAEEAGWVDIAFGYHNIIVQMRKYGIRNSTTSTVAPTGTLSILADTSGGCEPEFSLYTSRWQAGVEMIEVNPVFTRMLKARNVPQSDIEIIISALKTTNIRSGRTGEIAQYGSHGSLVRALTHNLVTGITEQTDHVLLDLMEFFVVAGDIAPKDHILMQAAIQKFNDSATSKTINFPEEATREDVAEAYNLALKTGCKGVTIYRDNSRKFQPLTAGAKPAAEATTEVVAETASVLDSDPPSEGTLHVDSLITGVEGAPDLYVNNLIIVHKLDVEPVQLQTPRTRPSRLFGFADRIETGDGRMHLQVGYDDLGIREVIATIGKGGGVLNGLVEALGRVISLALKYRVPVREIAGQLSGIRSANTYGFGPKQVLSIPDAIGKTLAEAPAELVSTTSNDLEEELGIDLHVEPEDLDPSAAAVAIANASLDHVHDYGESPECPQCNAPMKFGEGCRGGSCTNASCGYARC